MFYDRAVYFCNKLLDQIKNKICRNCTKIKLEEFLKKKILKEKKLRGHFRQLSDALHHKTCFIFRY